MSFRPPPMSVMGTCRRSWRDSGLTWLAISGLGVDKISRRAGHDMIQTTMGYVKQAADLTGDLGVPFGPLHGPNAYTLRCSVEET